MEGSLLKAVLKVHIDTSESVRDLRDLKMHIEKQKRKIVFEEVEHVKRVAAGWFLKGTRGFRPRPGGILRSEGLREGEIHVVKRKAYKVLWHPLATLYANFKKRRRIRWLDIINRVAKRGVR